MMGRKRFLIGALLLLTWLSGCNEPPPPEAPPPAKKVVSNKAADAASEKPAVVAPPKYVYDVSGRRDPFTPLMLIKKPVLPKGEEVPLTPLQQYDVDQFRLTGVILGKGEPVAMVLAPDGKAYILKKGVFIGKNSGRVVKIVADIVFVKEKYQDFSGEVRENVVEIQLPKRGGA